MCSKKTVVGAGIACLDHIVVSPQPQWGQTAEASEYAVEGGGLTATALVACARLGAEAHWAGMLGGDWTGERIAAGLREEHVGLDHVLWFAGADSPFSFVHVDPASGERTIFHRRARGLHWPENGTIGLEKADVVLVDGYFPALAQAAVLEARKRGIPCVADAVPGPENEAWLRHVSVLITPEEYLARGGFGGRMEAALEAMHRLGPETAVITLGARGWSTSDAHGRHTGPAFPVAAVDTLGAGDVFHGAFAFALAQRWTTPRCAAFAAACAALKCTRRGGRAGIPTLRQALDFLGEHDMQSWNHISIDETTQGT